jgi:hypothetical protein
MPTQKIDREEWVEFFDQFSRRHRGWLITLEVMAPDLGDQIQVRELPLEGITAELKASGDEIEIIAGNLDAHLSHTIARPARVWIKRTEEGADETLEIESESGAALLRLRSAVLPEIVDGLP